MSALRVAFVVGSYGYSGSERQLVHMCKCLDSAGVEVSVWNTVRSDFFSSALSGSAVRLFRYGQIPTPAAQLPVLTARLARLRPHIIQSVQFWVNAYVGIAARAIGAIGVGAQRSDVDTAFRTFGASMGPRLLRLPHAIVANSFRSRTQLIERGLLPAERVYMLGNRLDLARFTPRMAAAASGPCTAVIVGRLEPGKRVDVFLRAIAQARAQGVPVRGQIIGDGSERQAMQKLSRELGLGADDVQFMGYVADPAPIVRRASVLVHCSESEGSANVVMEAMACGLPVLATPVGDAEMLIENGVSGWVFPVGDVDTLARRLAALGVSEDLRRSMGAAARARAEKDFSLETLADSLLTIYRDIAATHAFRRRVRECLS